MKTFFLGLQTPWKWAVAVLAMALITIQAVEPVVSYMVVDHYSGKILAQKNADQKLPVASLTKIATACVVLDWAQVTKTDLGQRMTVPQSAAMLAQATAVGLQPGDVLTLRDGLYAALMASDNVAAESLAMHVGVDMLRRRNKSGLPMVEFLREMEALSAKLNMLSTKYVNAHGLDFGLKNRPHSTASDMCRLSKYAMEKVGFRFYVSQGSRKIKVNRFGNRRAFKLTNTNQLLGKMQIDGVKTGQTQASGPCLAVSSKRPNQITKFPDGSSQIQKRRVTAVILGAQDRFRAGRDLIDYGWQQYDAWNVAGRPKQDPQGFLPGF